MPKFHIGEIAKTKVSLNSCTRGSIPIGTEVRIIGLPGCCPKHLRSYYPELSTHYELEAEGFYSPDSIWAGEEHLEKIVGSWDEIEKITGTKFPRTKEKEREKETA